MTDPAFVPFERMSTGSQADAVTRVGRAIVLAGVVLPLLLIGALKFTQTEIDALEPLISNTPWLAWLYPAFGKAGASHFLGVVELTAALMFVLSLRWTWAGIVAGVLGAVTFTLTTSLLIALPVWAERSGGFPWLNDAGSFLIKDVALLGISVTVFGESLARIIGRQTVTARSSVGPDA